MTTRQTPVSPRKVLAEVAAALPADLHPHLVVIGSLAAAYWLLHSKRNSGVRTKDIDCVLSPRFSAVEKGRLVAERLFESGWKPRTQGPFATPGTIHTPPDKLPAVRLHPPHDAEWFIELLTEPDQESADARQWTPLALGSGEYYALPSFRFTGIATFQAPRSESGLRCAQPAMMTLANLLEHPTIRPDLISDTRDKRCNKDLGRAISIARLTSENEMADWPRLWIEALKTGFPTHWKNLAHQAESGLHALLASPQDLQQAADIANRSLLAANPAGEKAFRASTAQLLAFPLSELKSLADSAS